MISSVWQYDSERWVLHAFQGCKNFHYKHLIKQDSDPLRDELCVPVLCVESSAAVLWRLKTTNSDK